MKKIRIMCLASLMLLLTGCGHEHQWSEATCEEPKKCVECGETEGEPLSHQWSEATCTAPKTCSICGATEGEALEHTWDEATFEKPKTCSVCGTTEGEALKTFVEERNITYTEETSFTLPWAFDYTDKEFTKQVDYKGVTYKQGDGIVSIKSVNYADSDREGYKDIEIKYDQNYSFECIANWNQYNGEDFYYYLLMPAFMMGDLYTGIDFPGANVTEKQRDYTHKFELPHVDVSYEIEYAVTDERESDISGWKQISDVEEKFTGTQCMHTTIYLSVPEEYDGTVLYIPTAGITEINYEDLNKTVEENVAEDGIEYILDEDDTAEDAYFIRVSDLIERMGNKVDTITPFEENVQGE